MPPEERVEWGDVEVDLGEDMDTCSSRDKTREARMTGAVDVGVGEAGAGRGGAEGRVTEMVEVWKREAVGGSSRGEGHV